MRTEEKKKLKIRQISKIPGEVFDISEMIDSQKMIFRGNSTGGLLDALLDVSPKKGKLKKMKTYMPPKPKAKNNSDINGSNSNNSPNPEKRFQTPRTLKPNNDLKIDSSNMESSTVNTNTKKVKLTDRDISTEEEFQIKMVDFYGNTYIFNGKSQGEVTEFTSVNSQANVKKLQETFKNYNLDNVNVSQGEKGLTLSIENIQFEPDSDKLLPSEQKKLQKIGEVLKQFNNDLLITGHCAERGTESARQALSESRAKSVADFLTKNNIRNEYHIFTQGKGSSQPVASNTTEEGRSRNRRVEITIMD